MPSGPGGPPLEAGSWFLYCAVESDSAGGRVSWIEKRTIISADGGAVVFSAERDGVYLGEVSGDPSFADGAVSGGGFSPAGRAAVTSPSGAVDAFLYRRSLCGGGAEVAVGADGRMLRCELTQLWSGGAVHRITMQLLASGGPEGAVVSAPRARPGR